MKPLIAAFLFISLLIPGVNYAQTAVKAGDKAPEFSAKDQDGKTITLSQLKGKKIVLYFYPKDFSLGCTDQACSLRDNISSLTKEGYTILGVSTDDEASHKGFKEKNALPFSLLADVDQSINKKYGVWTKRERDGKETWGTKRTTFIINEKGFINKVIDNVDTKNHASQILSFAK